MTQRSEHPLMDTEASLSMHAHELICYHCFWALLASKWKCIRKRSRKKKKNVLLCAAKWNSPPATFLFFAEFFSCVVECLPKCIQRERGTEEKKGTQKAVPVEMKDDLFQPSSWADESPNKYGSPASLLACSLVFVSPCLTVFL